MTLRQLYEGTKQRFKLKVLAGESYMNREVSRLYYVEDTRISDWTRHGELIVSTVMAYHTEEKLKIFIDSLLPYEPPGIMINQGGYINEIPESILSYCEEIKMPLIVFPWDIYLQDIIQGLTNMIFEAEQKENSISNGFLNAIFEPEKKDEYESVLTRNGFQDFKIFFVASMEISDLQDIEYHFVRRRMKECCKNVIFCKRETEVILVFYGIEAKKIQANIKHAFEQCTLAFQKSTFHMGIGDAAICFQELRDSYERACGCRKLCQEKQNEIIFFLDLDILGILITSDPVLLKHYYEKNLGKLENYDKQNQTMYLETLESYIHHNANTAEVADELFLHRNTVNYRLKKIESLLNIKLADINAITKCQIAFHIRRLLKIK